VSTDDHTFRETFGASGAHEVEVQRFEHRRPRIAHGDPRQGGAKDQRWDPQDLEIRGDVLPRRRVLEWRSPVEQDEGEDDHDQTEREAGYRETSDGQAAGGVVKR